MRVASRRLRTALRLFADALPEKRVKAARGQLKWIGTGLGPARDLDVQLARLRRGFKPAGKSGRRAKRAFADWLDLRRDLARSKMLRVLDSARFRRFLASFGAYLEEGPPRRSGRTRAGQPIAAVAPKLLLPALDKVVRKGEKLTHCRPAGELHRFRVRCKRVRYLCEFLRGLYRRAAKETATRLIRVQDALGGLQDAIVGQRQLAAFMEENRRGRGPLSGDDPGQYRLAAWYIGNAESSRRVFGKVWRRVEKPGHQRALIEAIENAAD
jgi:CHAD domain-containing protein